MKDPFVNCAQSTEMKVNGLSCELNMPPALTQRMVDGQEVAHSLPPHARRAAFVVDEYSACPQNWMRGSGEASSYFVPVLPEHGLWLDFNKNRSHSHYVAVVISVQGINAITGQQTKKLRLEQYRKKCPVHKVEFGHERYCEECGYKWPEQNYLASNATKSGYLWLDGFRSQDGEVRQYVFTEESARGVAAQLIGDERVYAIGIAFYLSKEPKPATSIYQSWGIPMGAGFYTPFTTTDAFQVYGSPSIGASGQSFMKRSKAHYTESSCNDEVMCASLAMNCNDSDAFDGLNMRECAESAEPVTVTTLEIAAGAKINQAVAADSEKLSFWQKEPAGVIYINYVSCEDAEKIVAAGKSDLTASGEGFLNGLKVGAK